MLNFKLTDRNFERYLRLLGVQKQKPSLEYLTKLVESQIKKIPFENISKLYYKKRLNLQHLIDFELYLNGIESFGFGGTCYAVNFYLNQLLRWLGFNVKLCGADMKQPDVHLVNIVNIENREFLVDAGNAAPFFEPIPLYLPNDYIVESGKDRYIFNTHHHKPQLKLYRNGTLIHAYSVNPLARHINDFQEIIKDSFKDDSTFMNALLLTILKNNKFVTIHNMTITETNGRLFKSQTFSSVELLASAINNLFSIPVEIIHESIEGLGMQKTAWNGD